MHKWLLRQMYEAAQPVRDVNRAIGLFRQLMPPRALLLFLLGAVVLFSVGAAFGAEPDKYLDAIQTTYKSLSGTWYTKIKLYAERLFWILVLIDVSWSGVIYTLEKNDIGEVALSLAKKLFPIGFFWAVLKLSDTWIPAILDSFSMIGKEAGGAPAGSATPDGILRVGWDIATTAFGVMRDLGTLESIAVLLPVTALALLIYLCFVFVSISLLLTLVESYVVTGAGVILLGFGGSRWTTDIATAYLKHAVGTGIKLMLTYLLIGGAADLFANMLISQSDVLGSLLTILGAALTYAVLVIKAPALAAGMMSGSPSLSGGDAITGALTMGAAMAGVGAMASGGVKQLAGAAGGAASGAAGIAKALGAGYSSALDTGKSGLGAVTGAVGEVAKHGLGLMSGGISDALKGGASSFADSVANSPGGQIASSIEATRGGSMSGATPSPSAAQGNAQTAASGPSPSSSASSPASAGASTASGSSNASSAASAPSTTTASGAPTGGGSAPVNSPAGSTNTASVGDASSASIGPGSVVSPPADTSNQGAQKAPLHERIRDLQGYVPQDMAQSASINIQSGHTAD